MGVLFDYFSAGSDDEAASVIDRVGGPGSQVVEAERAAEAKRGLLGRRRSTPKATFATDPGLVVYDTVSIKGIDPVVQVATLEELLTDRPYDDVIEAPRCGLVLDSRDGGERLVCALTDTLMTALAGADADVLQRVSVPWSQTDEFYGAADPEDLAAVLGDLAGLARRSQANGQRLYCWVCV